MAVKIGSLLIRLAVEHGLLQEGLARSEQDIAKTTKAIQRRGRDIADFGKQMSLAVSLPMAAIAKSAVDGFIDQQKAMADVTAALASMGGVSGKTADELSKAADALEMRSLFDAEVILKQVTAQLLTFGNVAGREFDRAQQAAVDMATRLGTEPQSAAIMLGKALNDPIKGITALTRVGVQFTEAQKAQIKAMSDAGDMAGAQGVILAEVERQFAGAAQAAADTSPWREAQVAIGQAMDAIGGAILPAIAPIGEAIAGMASAFASLPEPVQQAVVVLGAIAAIVGPIAVGLGSVISAGAATIAMLGGFPAILSVVGLALNTLLLSPLGLIVAAVAAVVAAWYYWDDIKAIVADLGRVVSAWWNENVAPVLGALKDLLVGAVTWWWNMQVGSVRALAQLVTGVKDWLVGKLGAIFDWVGKKINAVTGFFRDMYIAVVGNSYVPDMVDGIRVEMAKLQTYMVDPAQKAANGVEKAMRDLRERVQGHLAELFPELVAADEKASRIADLFAGERAGVISASTRRESVRRAQGFDEGPLKEAAEVNAAAESIAQSIGRVAETTRVQTVQIADSFKDMTEKSIQALDRMVNAIKGGGFLDILGSAVNLFLQLGSSGLFGSKLATSINAAQIPGNANGTAFHPGGLMMVGERGPEILQVPRGGRVVPNHELREAGQSAIRIILDERTDIVEARIGRSVAGKAPQIMDGSARLTESRLARRQTRRIGA
jgi:hypothetical protein